jgi:hypothetical protein
MMRGVLVLMLCVSCSKYSQKEEQAKAPPAGPTPPSAQTLSLERGPMVDALSGSAMRAGLHHAQASFFLALVDAHVASRLRAPAALLAAASGARPQLVDRGVRVWSFRAEVDGRPYASNLRSTTLEDSEAATWSLELTSLPRDAAGCCEDFELASGEAEVPGRGLWLLYDHRDATTPPSRLFSVAYEATAPDQRKLTVQVTSRKPSTERLGAGSLVVQEVRGDAVRLTLRDASEAGMRVFAWSRATGAGSYQDPAGKVVCWGGELEGFEDVACPEDESTAPSSL